MPRLTKRVVDAVRPDPAGREVFVWDDALRGFGLRMMPSGAASFFIQYRTLEGRTRRLRIGKVGTLTPEQAREIGRNKLAAAASCADPSADRRAAKASMSIAELCDLYLSEAEGHIKASTLAMDRSRIERHVKPLIGRHPVRSLTPEDVERMQLDIAAGKTAQKRGNGRGGVTTGGRGVAARTVGMLGTILELARRRRLVRENPARGVGRLPDGKQRRFLNVEEIAKLGTAMRDAATEGMKSHTGFSTIRFLLLTGVRRMEALALTWRQVDARSRCLLFSDTKSGAQLRPIGDAAVALLDSLPRSADSPFVFPADRGNRHFVGLPRVLSRVSSRAKLSGVTIHVLRHTFASVAAEMGFSELRIAGLLGHSMPGVAARYAHVPDRALVAAASQISTCIAAALDGNPRSVVLDLDWRRRSGGVSV